MASHAASGTIGATWSFSGTLSVAWEYDNDPSVSNVMAVRFLLGDTNPSDRLLSHAEVQYLLTENGNVVVSAAAQGAEILAARFAREADITVGDVSISKSQIAAAFRDLAAQLQTRLGKLAAPIFGGVFTSKKQAKAQDTSLVQPVFRVGMSDNRPTSRSLSTAYEDDECL